MCRDRIIVTGDLEGQLSLPRSSLSLTRGLEHHAPVGSVGLAGNGGQYELVLGEKWREGLRQVGWPREFGCGSSLVTSGSSCSERLLPGGQCVVTATSWNGHFGFYIYRWAAIHQAHAGWQSLKFSVFKSLFFTKRNFIKLSDFQRDVVDKWRKTLKRVQDSHVIKNCNVEGDKIFESSVFSFPPDNWGKSDFSPTCKDGHF